MQTIAVAAVTLDGKIALDAGSGSGWTSKEDKDFLHEFLDGCDAVVLGHNTYKTAEKFLDKRDCIVLTTSVATPERKGERLLLWNPAGATLEAVAGEYKKVAVLGGAQTYSYFLDHDLLDELHLTVEPLVFGRGVGLFAPLKAHMPRFSLLSMEKLNDEGAVLLHYKVTKA